MVFFMGKVHLLRGAKGACFMIWHGDRGSMEDS